MTATVPSCPSCGRRCMACLTRIAAAGVTPSAPAAVVSSSGSAALPLSDPGDDSSEWAPPFGIPRPAVPS